VLGGSDGALGLLQAGSPMTDSLASVIVIDGVASALTLTPATAVPESALRLAEEAAAALVADLIAVEVALAPGGPIVWDAQPVPDFRHALPIGDRDVAHAIARAVERRLLTPATGDPLDKQTRSWVSLTREGKPGVVVISA
jgi:hypothetical protein